MTHDMKVASSVRNVPGAIVPIAFQPLPRMFIKKAKELGDIVMDFDEAVDGIIMELHCSYWFEADHPQIDQATVQTYTTLGNKVKGYQEEGLLDSTHLPFFMNDAYFRQDY